MERPGLEIRSLCSPLAPGQDYALGKKKILPPGTPAFLSPR